MGVFDRGAGHEQVTYFADPASGLRAIIAIYSTALGPALGGTRFYPYASEEDALADVLNLSKAMAYKAACAGTRLREVDPYDTSQDCSGCGVRVPKVLGDRLHECAHCGLVIDRDLNAARNILHRAGVGPGLPNVTGYGMRAGGNLVGGGVPNCPRTCESLH